MSPADFAYDSEGARYLCPEGQALRRVGEVSGEARPSGTIAHQSRAGDWKGCPIKTRCTTSLTRASSRSLHQDVRTTVEARQSSEACTRSLRRSKCVERLFACVKQSCDFNCFQLHRLHAADEEFVLASTAQNLMRMTKLLPGRAVGTEMVAA